MLEIFKQILSLPIDSINPDDLRQLAYDLKLNDKDFAAKINANADLVTWLNVINALLVLVKELGKAWSHTYKLEFAAEMLIEALYELLPNEIGELKAIVSKMDMIQSVGLCEEVGYAFTALCAAAYKKFHDLKCGNVLCDAELTTKITCITQPILKSIQSKEKLQSLHAHYLEYKQEMNALLIEQIKLKHFAYYEKHLTSLKPADDIIAIINKSLENSSLVIDADLTLLIQKYSAVLMLGHQITHPKPTSDTLTTLARLFNDHKELFHSKPNLVTKPTSTFYATVNYLATSRALSLFKASSIEDKFLKAAALFCADILKENEPLLKSEATAVTASP